MHSIRTDLTVTASLVRKNYEKSVRIDSRTMETLIVEKHETIPRSNYKIRKQTLGLAECMTSEGQIF